MHKRWFASVKRGIGWYPVTWQGWAVTIVYILFIIYDFQRIDKNSHSVSDTIIAFLPEFGIATAALAFICYFTGEKPNT